MAAACRVAERRKAKALPQVEIHEIEERKNLHINQLIKSHEEAFEKMRSYYNDVTRGNIEVIKSLKVGLVQGLQATTHTSLLGLYSEPQAEVAQRQKKKEENAKLMQSVAEENQRLIKPLKIATEKVESLKADLRDAEKHRMSLRNSKARVLVCLPNWPCASFPVKPTPLCL